MVSLQCLHRRLARSAALVLAALVAANSARAELCANPGRDGDEPDAEVVNRYFTGSESQLLKAGSRAITLARQRGADGFQSDALQSGDLALLVQMQGVSVSYANSPEYGTPKRHALHQEWLRIEDVAGKQVRLRGGGEKGGLRHRYRNAPASGEQGRFRWQLISVPQFQQLTLSHDLQALPWNGYTGGVLALDVRRTLDLKGHGLSVAGEGFRGGQALSLLGALGRPQDWRYSAPSQEGLVAGYGHHGMKGEGIAGTPGHLLDGDEAGYPQGDMARGAPGNAGGGGNGLDLSHEQLANGGGGGNGKPGSPGKPADGGGQGGHVIAHGLTLGGGGGAAARRRGEGGHGGAGGGLIVIRAADLQGPGRLVLQGEAGASGVKAGGGGGAGGTLALDVPVDVTPLQFIDLAGGWGGGPGGGQGGEGRRLALGQGQWPGYRPVQIPGVAPGYQCRPAGHWVSGVVFSDNGGAQRDLAPQAFNGRPDPQESRLADWPVALVSEDGATIKTTKTNEQGRFVLRLSEKESHGQALTLQLTLANDWSLPFLPPLGHRPGRRRGNTLSWPVQAQPEQHSGPLQLGLVPVPHWQGPANQSLKAGSTSVLTFEYRATVTGQVRFSSDSPVVRNMLMDRQCNGDSEQWQGGGNTAWPVVVGERLCVRIPVSYDGENPQVAVTAQTLPQATPSRPGWRQTQSVTFTREP